MTPSYLKLFHSGELKQRAQVALAYLSNCQICPRKCAVNRFEVNSGYCKSGFLPVVSAYAPHFGEEPELSGEKGCGNIFFGNCNLKCVYCQNFEISQSWKSEINNEISFEKLAEIMLELQNRGCHSIGLVSPSHFVPQIINSLIPAIERGLRLPLIYNSNGYDSIDMLKLLSGIVDIYLPDFKYGNDLEAKEYSNVKNYFETAVNSITEMHQQVGSDLLIENNIIHRGMIIRHLVLPNDISDTEIVLKTIAEKLGTDIHISLMSQYYPTENVTNDVLISRKIRESEYSRAISLLDKYGFHRGWIQSIESTDNYRPSFNENRINPFNDKRV